MNRFPFLNVGKAISGVVGRNYETIPIIECGSVCSKEFTTLIKSQYVKQEPVIVRNCLQCRALENWKNFHYLSSKIGDERLVEVEIGEYIRGDKLEIPFGSYLDYLKLTLEHKGPLPPENILYLAQTDLPEELYEDISIPELCRNSDLGVGEGKLYQVMFWMGPHSTKSPLHNDPLDNFLMQICGTKTVTLVHKDTPAECLYLGEGPDQQRNTSAVDVEFPDLRRFPRFGDADLMVATLVPGDLLYIPSRTFHFLRSNSFSISVNAWWR